MDFTISGLDTGRASSDELLRRGPAGTAQIEVRIGVVVCVGTTDIAIVACAVARPDCVLATTYRCGFFFREDVVLYRKHFQIFHNGSFFKVKHGPFYLIVSIKRTVPFAGRLVDNLDPDVARGPGTVVIHLPDPVDHARRMKTALLVSCVVVGS